MLVSSNALRTCRGRHHEYRQNGVAIDDRCLADDTQGRRIRLFGIDAPEGAQTCEYEDGTTYRCGTTAARALDEMIGEKTVSCEPRDSDGFGRIVALCRANGADIAEQLVRAGAALDYPRYSKGAYKAAQIAADRANTGMWQGRFIEPWLYRACVNTGGRPADCSKGQR